MVRTSSTPRSCSMGRTSSADRNPPTRGAHTQGVDRNAHPWAAQRRGGKAGPGAFDVLKWTTQMVPESGATWLP